MLVSIIIFSGFNEGSVNSYKLPLRGALAYPRVTRGGHKPCGRISFGILSVSRVLDIGVSEQGTGGLREGGNPLVRGIVRDALNKLSWLPFPPGLDDGAFVLPDAFGYLQRAQRRAE
jgi:hypothetical protein